MIANTNSYLPICNRIFIDYILKFLTYKYSSSVNAYFSPKRILFFVLVVQAEYSDKTYFG